MTPTIDSTLQLKDRFQALFEVHEGRTMNGTNAALAARRREAIGHLASLGLPTRKTEAWKYTPIEKRIPKEANIYVESAPVSMARATAARHFIPGLDAYVAVTFNGRLVTEWSSAGGLPKSVTLDGIHAVSEKNPDLLNAYFGSQADSSSEPFIALNTAFTRDGLFFHVPPGVQVDKPIHVVHLFDTEPGVIVQPRLLYVLEDGSRATLIESFVDASSHPLFVNAVTEWIVGKNAYADHFQIQEYGIESSVVQTLQAHQARSSHFDTHTTILKAGFLRNNLNIVPDDEECESHLFGFVMGSGSMHVDNHTLVDHKKPNCFSNEFYKSILDDRATGVFNGKVFVRPDAQKTNAYQSNKSITLTPTARMYSKPELEIYADDVKCSHGATTGQLDAEALFYLRSRGLSLSKARSILLMAFARDVIDKIGVEPLREYLDQRIAETL